MRKVEGYSKSMPHHKFSVYVSRIRCVKSVRIRSFYGPYFPTFGLNTDQKNSKYGHFSRSDIRLDNRLP